MKKNIDVDVAVMGSGVAGMGAAYKLANAGGLKIAVFENIRPKAEQFLTAPCAFVPHQIRRKLRKALMKCWRDFPITQQTWG